MPHRTIRHRPHSTRDIPGLSRQYREHMAALLCALVDLEDVPYNSPQWYPLAERIHELRIETGRLSYLILARTGYSVKAWKRLRGG